MKVAFTGINNLSVYSDNTPKKVFFHFSNGVRQCADAKYYGVMIECDLSDDEEGSHLKDMYDVFKKTSEFYTNSSHPKKLAFSTEHFDIYTLAGIIPKDVIKINSYPIDLSSPNDKVLLPFYTFLARMTREIMAMSKDKDFNKVLQVSNNMISRNAEHFIDEVM